MKNQKNIPIKAGLAAYFLIFIFGFGVMLVMYLFWLKHSAPLYPPLKGLFDYKSSAWGDAICLPMLIGSGIAFVNYYGKHADRGKIKRIPLIMGVIGGFLGAAEQAKWVISDKTLLNWSIPRQHFFNYAGWYHAVFFVSICFAIPYVLTYVFQIEKNAVRSRQIDRGSKWRCDFYSVSQFLMWFAGILFLHFNYLDNLADKYHPILIVAVIDIGALSLLSLGRLLLIGDKKGANYAPMLMAAIIATLLAFISTFENPRVDYGYLIPGILFMIMYVYESENTIETVGEAVLFMCVGWLILLVVTSVADYERISTASRVIITAIALLVPFFLSLVYSYFIHKTYQKERERAFTIAILSFIVNVLLAATLAFEEQVNSILGQEVIPGISELKDIFPMIITTCLPYYVKHSFKKIVESEGNPAVDHKHVNQIKIIHYTKYGAICVAGLVILSKSFNFNNSFSISVGELRSMAFLLIASVFSCVIAWRNKNKPTSQIGAASSKKTIPVSTGIAYCILAIILLADGATRIREVLSSGQLPWYTGIILFHIVMISCAFSVYLTLNILFNICLIRQKGIAQFELVSSVIIGLSSGVFFSILAFELIFDQSLYSIMRLFFVTMLVSAIIPFLSLRRMGHFEPVGIIDNNPVLAVMQAGFLYGAVAVVNVVVSSGCFAEYGWLSGILTMVWFSIIIDLLWSICVDSNFEHQKRKKKTMLQMWDSITSDTEREKLEQQYSFLERLVGLSYSFAVILSLPYSIVFYVRKIVRK